MRRWFTKIQVACKIARQLAEKKLLFGAISNNIEFWQVCFERFRCEYIHGGVATRIRRSMIQENGKLKNLKILIQTVKCW